MTIRAVSATELRVRWIPLSQGEWYGIPRGYNISYRIIDDSSKLHSLSIEDPTRYGVGVGVGWARPKNFGELGWAGPDL